MLDGRIQPPILAAGIAFLVAIIMGPTTIHYLRRLKFGQNIRQDGPKRHLQKTGTPTMGGVMILLALTIATLAVGRGDNRLLFGLFVTIGFGAIGLLDDLIKILTRQSLGLKARQKLIGQLTFAVFVGLYALTQDSIGTAVLVPFTKYSVELPSMVYLALVVVVMLGTANAVNLTDGLDGLASGTVAVAAGSYAILAGWLGDPEMALFAAALAGACLGFSWFNAHPASVFMGDTGSLGLGAALGVLAIFTRTPLVLPIIGGLFVLETVSVMMQVGYYKLSHGKRIFKMAPLHHHFELQGWEEPKVMIRFWLISIFFAVIGLLAVL